MLILWLFWGATPQTTMTWIEQKWSSLTGKVLTEASEQISQKQKKRAYRHLYVQETDNPTKNKQGHISQPHKNEYKKNEH